MTYRELKNKFKDYDVIAFGRPLDVPTIPFTMLPRDKKLDECEVVEYRIEDKEQAITGVNFATMKPIKLYKIKGKVYTYVK